MIPVLAAINPVTIDSTEKDPTIAKMNAHHHRLRLKTLPSQDQRKFSQDTHLKVDVELLEQSGRNIVHQAMNLGLRAGRLFLLDDGVSKKVDAGLLHIQLDKTPVPLVEVRDSLCKDGDANKETWGSRQA